MEWAGKRADVVDFGGEMDYGNVQWFQDPPPRLPPQAEHPPPQSYVPSAAVIEQNEGFQYALSAAPNVLFQRYKQYGQLGVLAWCSEFSELIDNLKDMGFHGNMFVTTRTQALKTCEEVLQLLKIHMEEVRMQIVKMYLSSQVARLRRFLDGDRTWNDYPDSTFPLEPN
ncbi:hypothetical protein B0H34DRAFT_27016 [Crassisporium funariophilum]|nr:hypothetical protein B0H34DRAFT_27016 [Crassisporium funariophilum]